MVVRRALGLITRPQGGQATRRNGVVMADGGESVDDGFGSGSGHKAPARRGCEPGLANSNFLRCLWRLNAGRFRDGEASCHHSHGCAGCPRIRYLKSGVLLDRMRGPWASVAIHWLRFRPTLLSERGTLSRRRGSRHFLCSYDVAHSRGYPVLWRDRAPTWAPSHQRHPQERPFVRQRQMAGMAAQVIIARNGFRERDSRCRSGTPTHSRHRVPFTSHEALAHRLSRAKYGVMNAECPSLTWRHRR